MSDSYSEVGQVAAVEIEEAGGNAVGDHPAGSTTIQLEDASDFPEIETQARLGDTVVDVASVDAETNVLTLAAPSPVAVEDGDRVFVHPSAPTTWAHVIVDPTEPALLVEVPFGIKAFTGIAEGDLVRFTESSESGALTLVEVVGGAPSMHASHIDDAEELLLADQATLGEKLEEARVERDVAAARLTEAEQRLSDAFSEIDLLPDSDYVDAAKQQAIDAAAIEAQRLADEAKADAITDAQAHADGVAGTAEANAKAFATTMVDGLSKGVESTALPGTTVMPKDSVWRQTDSDGKYIAVFTQTASPQGSAWQARTIREEVLDGLSLGKLSVSGDATIRQAVIDQLVGQLATFIKADITNLTVTETSTLTNVVAERIWSDIASFVEVTADRVLAGNIQAVWSITSDGLIIAGDPTGARVEIAQDGIRLYTLGYNGLPRAAVTLVNDGEIAFQIHDQARGYVAGFSANGDVKGQQANFAGVAIRGSDLLGQIGGGAAPGWLDLLPRGIVRSGALSTSTAGSAPERVYARVIVTLQPGRRYRVAGVMNVNIGAVGAIRVRIRYENGGGAVTTSSPQLGDPATSGVSYSSNIGMDQRAETFHSVAAPTKVQFAVTYEGLGGSTPGGRGGRIYVEDVGPIGLNLDDEGEVPKTTYTTTWRATASRGYDKSGATIPSKENLLDLWYFGSTTAESAAVLFGGVAETVTDISEQGRTVPQALNTATIHSVELQVTNAMWWDPELNHLAVNALGSATLPATKVVEGATLVKNISEGASVWINLDPAPWANGINRGVTLGDKDNTLLGSQMGPGKFQAPGDPDSPLLRITYSR